MELVTDADGYSAPRLGEVELSPEQARAFHRVLMRAGRAHAVRAG